MKISQAMTDAINSFASRHNITENDVGLLAIDLPEPLSADDLAYYLARPNAERIKVDNLEYVFWDIVTPVSQE